MYLHQHCITLSVQVVVHRIERNFQSLFWTSTTIDLSAQPSWLRPALWIGEVERAVSAAGVEVAVLHNERTALPKAVHELEHKLASNGAQWVLAQIKPYNSFVLSDVL